MFKIKPSVIPITPWSTSADSYSARSPKPNNYFDYFSTDKAFDGISELPDSFRTCLKELGIDSYTRKALIELDSKELLQYIHTKTQNGISLEDIVKSNLERPKSKFPLILDKYSFIVFPKFFGHLIYWGQHLQTRYCERHGCNVEANILSKIKRDGSFAIIKYNEVVIRRNLADYELNTCLRSKDKAKLHTHLISKIEEIFQGMEKVSVPTEWKQRLKEEEIYEEGAHFQSHYSVPSLLFASAYNIESQNLVAGVVVNFGDHVQFIASSNDGEVIKVYTYLSNIVASAEIKFLHSPSCGYITQSPRYLGSGFKAYLKIECAYAKQLSDLKENYLDCCSMNFYQPKDEDSKNCIIIYNEKSYDINELKIITYILSVVQDIYRINSQLERTNTSEDLRSGRTPIECSIKLLSMIKSNKIYSYSKKYFEYDKHLIQLFTAFGGKVGHIIRISALHKNCLFPRACDPGAYDIFSKYLIQIIRDYNECRYIRHPTQPSYGLSSDLSHEMIYPKIKSYRVRYARNLAHYPFTILMTSQLRQEIEETFIKAFENMNNEEGDIGTYYSLTSLTAAQLNGLLRNNLIDNGSSSYKRTIGAYKDWPNNRGIFISNHCNSDFWIIALVNDLDHLSVRGIDWTGRNLNRIYYHCSSLVKLLDDYISFSEKRYLGFLGSRPHEVGTGLRISALTRLPYLSAHLDELEMLCKDCHLQIRGSKGAGSNTTGDILDLSVKTRINLTEIESFRKFKRSITKVLETEGYGVTEKKSIYNARQ